MTRAYRTELVLFNFSRDGDGIRESGIVGFVVQLLRFCVPKMDVERLIEEVRKFPVLYDQTNEKYRNTDYKDREWKKIATDLQAKGKIKIIRYFNIREIFIWCYFANRGYFFMLVFYRQGEFLPFHTPLWRIQEVFQLVSYGKCSISRSSTNSR